MKPHYKKRTGYRSGERRGLLIRYANTVGSSPTQSSNFYEGNMTPYEKLERAYEQYFKVYDKIDQLYLKFDQAKEKSDWWTCYKILSEIRFMMADSKKRINKAKLKYAAVV